MPAIDCRSSIFAGGSGSGGCSGGCFDSPSALEGKAPEDQMTRGVLLFAERDLLGRAKSLAADAFVDLLTLAAGFPECFNLRSD